MVGLVARQGRKFSDSKHLSVEIRESPVVSEVLRNTVTATDPQIFRPCGAKIKYGLVLYTPGSVMKHRNRLDPSKKIGPAGQVLILILSLYSRKSYEARRVTLKREGGGNEFH